MLDTFVIWSMEHHAWWAPARCGYCLTVAEAGRYTRDEALAIVIEANVVHCNEAMIPLDAIEPRDTP